MRNCYCYPSVHTHNSTSLSTRVLGAQQNEASDYRLTCKPTPYTNTHTHTHTHYALASQYTINDLMYTYTHVHKYDTISNLKACRTVIHGLIRRDRQVGGHH